MLRVGFEIGCELDKKGYSGIISTIVSDMNFSVLKTSRTSSHLEAIACRNRYITGKKGCEQRAGKKERHENNCLRHEKIIRDLRLTCAKYSGFWLLIHGC